MNTYEVTYINGKTERFHGDHYEYVHPQYPHENAVQFYKGKNICGWAFDVKKVEPK